MRDNLDALPTQERMRPRRNRRMDARRDTSRLTRTVKLDRSGRDERIGG